MVVRRNFTRTFALRPLKHRVQQAALSAADAVIVPPTGTPEERSRATHPQTRKRPAASPGAAGILRRRLREKSVPIKVQDNPPASGSLKRERFDSSEGKSQACVGRIQSPLSVKGSPQSLAASLPSSSSSSSSSWALPSTSSYSTPPPRARQAAKEATSQFSTPKRAQSARTRFSEGRAKRKAFHPMQKALEEEGLGVIMLEDEPSPILTREGILTKDHLLLPFETSQKALDLCNAMLKMVAVWHSDQTDLYTDIWEVYLLPTALRAVRAARSRKFNAAIADLLAILLFTTQQDLWLRKQEAHENWPSFQRFFEHSTEAWAAVLAQPDESLGLAPKSGRCGGYRMRLCSLIRCWQDLSNQVLKQEEWCRGRLTVRVLPEPVKAEP